MSIPQILEVAIGLIFVYYILGSIVSLITQWINEALETRGVALERYLKKIVGDTKLGDLTGMPQMKALRPIRYKNFLGVFNSVTEPKKLEKIPVGVLVDSYFDLVGLTGKELNADQMLELIGQLPASEGKDAVMGWIKQGVTNVNDLRSRMTSYFSGLMDQAAATFRSNARSFVILLSLGITLAFGTDSIQLARTLWNNAELRAIAAAKAEMVVSQEGTSASLDSLVAELGGLSIKIGWWQTERPESGATPMDWVRFILLKITGLGLTTIAVSQGSSFWYDLLKKIVGPSRSSSSGGDSSESKG